MPGYAYGIMNIQLPILLRYVAQRKLAVATRGDIDFL